jgi:hypothetical protein
MPDDHPGWKRLKKAAGLREAMEKRPAGGHCSVCGEPTDACLGRVKASICSHCVAKAVDAPKQKESQN